MITQQALENYEQNIIESAKEWVFGNDSINNQTELFIIAAHYKIRLPKCCCHFQYSNNPNELCSSGEFKSIFKVLGKLKNAIIETEELNFS